MRRGGEGGGEGEKIESAVEKNGKKNPAGRAAGEGSDRWEQTTASAWHASFQARAITPFSSRRFLGDARAPHTQTSREIKEDSRCVRIRRARRAGGAAIERRRVGRGWGKRGYACRQEVDKICRRGRDGEGEGDGKCAPSQRRDRPQQGRQRICAHGGRRERTEEEGGGKALVGVASLLRLG